MSNIFILLESLYFKYENTIYVNSKINLIKKINIIEQEIVKNLNIKNEEITKYIIEKFSKKTEFISGRYLFFLNKTDIPEKYTEAVKKIYLESILKYKLLTERRELTYFSIKGLEKFKSENFEDFIFSLQEYKIFSLYKQEFIILLGKTKSSVKSINFLITLLKRFPDYSEYIYWSIGIIVSYKRYPLIKRKLLNEILKKKIRILKNTKVNEMIYFSLIELFFIQNGIDGNLTNKILDILYQSEDKNILKKILIKIINNNEISSEDKNIILDLENKF